MKKTEGPQRIFGSLLELPKVMAGHCCAFWKLQYLLSPEKRLLVLKVMLWGKQGNSGRGKMHVSFQAANLQRSDKVCRIIIKFGGVEVYSSI